VTGIRSRNRARDERRGLGGRSNMRIAPSSASGLTQNRLLYKAFHYWRGGRVAEGGGLLNRYTV
jgi:hypothetical protein